MNPTTLEPRSHSANATPSTPHLDAPSAPRRVQILPPLVAERIAAGEVIERPSSVVKELLENSLDAGATEVAVILEDGGKSLIEVLDNGCGMGPDDLALSVQRHATSKLRSLEDLERLSTLGFRGEALPSIAAVSEFSLLSRPQKHDQAYELKVDPFTRQSKPKPTTFGHFLGSPHGTRIRARGLFAQVPARLKFLRSQGAEVSQVREWMERLALTHPQVGFRLVSDDRTVLNLRPQDEVTRVRAVLSDGEDYPVLSATYPESEDDLPLPYGMKIRLHWLQGLSSPQTRRLVQVVNGRALRDRMLQQAMLAPFRQTLLPGQFPAVALFIELDPSAIDVNVHPTKTEVRFLESGKIFHAVQKRVEALIAAHGAPAFAAASLSAAETAPRLDSRLMTQPSLDGLGKPKLWDFQQTAAATNSPTAANSWQAYRSATPAPAPSADPAQTAASAEPGAEAAHEPAAQTDPAPARHPLSEARFAGIVFNTYFLYELGGELALIDQHAAHERVRYEKLRTRALATRSGPAAETTSQPLLIPEAVRFPAEQRITLESRLPWLAQLGFEAELFGEDTALIRAVPLEWGTDELRTRLKSLIDRVLEQPEADSQGTDAPKNLLLDESLFEALASEACHSAVRAGDRLDATQAEALVEELFRCEHPWNCPHGRPTVARVPKARFEEWFQRRV